MSSIPAFPLTPTERLAKTHALLCSVGFLVLLPVGALIARYGRNFTRHWVNVHLVFQFLFAGPVIYAGCYKGHHTTSMLQFPHYQDTHQKIGLALLILYVCQASLGLVIHFFKTPSLFGGHRPPQNYLHVTLGLSILVLAAYQVHYGLYIEWLLLGGLHAVVKSAKNAWLALVVVFWSLYVLGLAFVPRQMKKEKEARAARKQKSESSVGSA